MRIYFIGGPADGDIIFNSKYLGDVYKFRTSCPMPETVDYSRIETTSSILPYEYYVNRWKDKKNAIYVPKKYYNKPMDEIFSAFLNTFDVQEIEMIF